MNPVAESVPTALTAWLDDPLCTDPVHYDSLTTGGKLMTDLYSAVTYGDRSGFGTFQWA